MIRPNGAVSPCIFWEGDPMGLLPGADGAAMNGASVTGTNFDLVAIDARIDELREGLRCGNPLGTCTHCAMRRDAFYVPERPADDLVPISLPAKS